MTSSRLDFGVLLAFAHVTFVDELDRHLRGAGFEGLSPRAGFVLRVLGDEPVSLRELADRLEMSSPGALKVIEPMLREGYLVRVGAADDRRVRAVALTDRGREALAAARGFHDRFERDLAAAVGVRSADQVRRALEAVVRRGSPLLPLALLPPGGTI